MQKMLFEVPGLNLGAPKTEAKNTDTGKNVVIKDKAKTPVKSEKVASPSVFPSHSKSKSKPMKDTPVETSGLVKTTVTGSQKSGSAIKSTASIQPKKIEKESGKSKLQQKMEEKLRGARFRYLNQKLYQSNSRDALNHFQEHPEDFQKVIYHFCMISKFY